MRDGSSEPKVDFESSLDEAVAKSPEARVLTGAKDRIDDLYQRLTTNERVRATGSEVAG